MVEKIIWIRWVGANALGEMVGLGLTFGVTGLTFSWLDSLPGAVGLLAAFFAAVLIGTIEATVVGLTQFWAMHPWFPKITRREWWMGTLGGALLAYGLGYLPSTLISLGEQSPSTAPIVEPPPWITLLLAAGMGAMAGAVLSFAQWLVLRKSVRRAGLWIPANMLAWLLGMPIIFWGIDLVFQVGQVLPGILIMAGVLLLTGALVGATHGIFLVKLAVKEAL